MEILDEFDERFGALVVGDGEEEEEGDQYDDYDHEDEEDNDLLLEVRKSYRQFSRIDVMTMWNEAEFFQRFRMSKHTISYVLSLIEVKLAPTAKRNR